MVDVFILVAVAIIVLGGMTDCGDVPDWMGNLSDDVLVVPLALSDAFRWVLIRRIAQVG